MDLISDRKKKIKAKFRKCVHHVRVETTVLIVTTGPVTSWLFLAQNKNKKNEEICKYKVMLCRSLNVCGIKIIIKIIKRERRR